MNLRTIGTLSLLLVSSAAWCAPQVPPSLAQFDEEVAQCRRLIRDYCALAQELAKMKELDIEKQGQALNILKAARERWQLVSERYADNPPTEYAGDALFKTRLRDFDNALDDMQRALAAGQARRSFLACGFACGQFVKMHEDNGLTYALDRLYHLRQTANTAAAVMKTQGLAPLCELLPTLLERRDRVLLTPVPWPAGDERNTAYLEAVRDLSRSVDELALAVAANDAEHAAAILQGLVALINKPYTLAL